MDLEEQPAPAVGGKTLKEKKKKGKAVKATGSGKWSAPVKGDHSIAVAAPEVGPGDHGSRGGAGHTRNTSIGSVPGTALAAGGAKGKRSTPSPTATLRKGTPSPGQEALRPGKGGRSGSSSPRAVAASRSPSPGMPGSPSPPAPDIAGVGEGRRKSSPTTATVWRGGVAADSIASGVSKRRGARSQTASGGPSRGGVGSASAGRKQAAGKSKAQMSKSFDERNMQAIKNAFHAPDGSATRGQTQVPPPTLQSTTWAVDGGIDAVSEDFVLDEELCSLHEESIHDDEEEMLAVSGDLDALSGDYSVGSSFTSGSALGTGAFLPVGKAHVMSGLEEWVAEAAEQKMMPVPQGKQRLDDLLSESENYPSKNPEEIQVCLNISPLRSSPRAEHYPIAMLTKSSHGSCSSQIHPDMIGNNIWNRMKALEKLVELQRNAQAVDRGGGAPAPLPVQPTTSVPVHSMSVKDIEREILSLSDTYPPRSMGTTAGGVAEQRGAGAEACTLQRQLSGGAAAPDAEMMIRGGGRAGERVAASPQSNGSKNFTNKMQVPRIDLGAIHAGGDGIAAPIHVETGSSYAESDDGYGGSREDDVRARARAHQFSSCDCVCGGG